jgi:hypothetical protein
MLANFFGVLAVSSKENGGIGLDAVVVTAGIFVPPDLAGRIPYDERQLRYAAARRGFYMIYMRGREARRRKQAGVSPWMLIAEDQGCNLLWVDIDVEQGTLDLDDFARALEKKPKIAAFGYASNLLGTVNPVKKLTGMAKDTGALVYIDAVQYAPHGAIDVQDIGCDFLVCSSYKFFGPHAGSLYGKYDLLNELKAYKVRPASNELPSDDSLQAINDRFVGESNFVTLSTKAMILAKLARTNEADSVMKKALAAGVTIYTVDLIDTGEMTGSSNEMILLQRGRGELRRAPRVRDGAGRDAGARLPSHRRESDCRTRSDGPRPAGCCRRRRRGARRQGGAGPRRAR